MNYEIVQDYDPINPREHDCFGTILYISSRYCLGDNRVSSDELDAIISNPDNIVLPVYAYIHGGVALNTSGFSCQWDSGQSGCIYVSKTKVRETFGVKRITARTLKRAINCLKSEVEEFSKFLNGEVYGYILRDNDGREIDSCYGFIGEDVAKKEAEAALKFLSEKVA